MERQLMTILCKDCGYFNEEIDDPYSPYPYECEDCYRYEICLKAKEKEDSSQKPMTKVTGL